MNDERPRVRVSGAANLAATVPSLLGFVPDPGSVIVIGLHDRMVGMTMRADLPGTMPERERLARQLAAAMRRGDDRVTAVAVVGWNTATGDANGLLHDLRREGLRVVAGLTVQEREGRWEVLDEHPDAEDARWEPLGVDAVRPVAAVEYGAVVADSRDELAARIAPSGEPDDLDERQLTRLADPDTRDDMIGALANCGVDELLMLRDDYARLARVGTGAGRSGALVLVALTSWLSGDGAMVNVALDACPTDYRLAVLLRQALRIPLNPAQIRDLVASMGTASRT